MAQPEMRKLPTKEEIQKLSELEAANEIYYTCTHIQKFLMDEGAPEELRKKNENAYMTVGYADNKKDVNAELKQGMTLMNDVMSQKYKGKPLIVYAVEHNWVSESFLDLIQHENNLLGIQKTFPKAKNSKPEELENEAEVEDELEDEAEEKVEEKEPENPELTKYETYIQRKLGEIKKLPAGEKRNAAASRLFVAAYLQVNLKNNQQPCPAFSEKAIDKLSEAMGKTNFFVGLMEAWGDDIRKKDAEVFRGIAYNDYALIDDLGEINFNDLIVQAHEEFPPIAEEPEVKDKQQPKAEDAGEFELVDKDKIEKQQLQEAQARIDHDNAKQYIERMQAAMKSRPRTAVPSKTELKLQKMLVTRIFATRIGLDAESGSWRGKALDKTRSAEVKDKEKKALSVMENDQVLALWMKKRGYDKVRSLIATGHGGAMERDFKKFLCTVPTSKFNANTPERFLPTAKQRCEGLQSMLKDIRKVERRTGVPDPTRIESKKEFCLSLLATRKAAGAVRGGANLGNTIDPKAEKEWLNKIKSNEKLMDAVNKIATSPERSHTLDLALEGHGGKFLEAVEAEAGVELDSLANAPKVNDKPEIPKAGGPVLWAP